MTYEKNPCSTCEHCTKISHIFSKGKEEYLCRLMELESFSYMLEYNYSIENCKNYKKAEVCKKENRKYNCIITIRSN